MAQSYQTHRASFLGVSYVVTSALDGRVQGEKIASASTLANSCQLSFQKVIAQYDVIVVNIIISTLNSVCQAHHMLNTHTELCEINTNWCSVLSTRHV